MPNRIKHHGTELGGAAVSLIGAITASQEQVEWYTRMVVYAISGLAGLASLYSFFKNRAKNRKAVQTTAVFIEKELARKDLSEERRSAYMILLTKLANNQTISDDDMKFLK